MGAPGGGPYHETWRRPAGKRPLIWAHRGASADAPENTLPAFSLAVEQGAEGIECDVRLCGSGEIVVVHDGDLLRLAGLSAPVRALALGELRPLRILAGRFPGLEAGIPTLEEAIRSQPPHLRWNVELKVDRHREAAPLAEAVVGLVRKLGIEERVLLSSFHPLALLTCRRLAPHLATAYLWEPDGSFPRAWHWMWGHATATAALHPPVTDVREEAVARWRRRGLAVNAWVADDPDEILRLARAGVDGVITNVPAVARAALGG